MAFHTKKIRTERAIRQQQSSNLVPERVDSQHKVSYIPNDLIAIPGTPY